MKVQILNNIEKKKTISHRCFVIGIVSTTDKRRLVIVR